MVWEAIVSYFYANARDGRYKTHCLALCPNYLNSFFENNFSAKSSLLSILILNKSSQHCLTLFFFFFFVFFVISKKFY